MTPVSIDFETFYSNKLKYGLKYSIAEEYCRHELFDCYLISVSDGTNCWAGHPKDFNWSALDGKVLLSHNRRFDNAVYNELVHRKLAPRLNIPTWHCTADLSSYVCNRRALKQAVEFLFQAKVAKDYRDIANNKRWPQDYTEEERAYVAQAGRVDAHWCWKIWDTYGAQWPEWERKLSALTADQGMYGVQINTELLTNYLIWTHEMRTNIEQVIPWIRDSEDESWDEFNTRPTSTKCIAEQCRRVRIPCPPVKSDDEEEYEAWETQYAPQHPWIRAVSSWRSVQKLYKTFQSVKSRLRPDGTMPFALKYFGGHTGRWSGDAKVNMQNMRKKPALCNEHGLLEADEKRINIALEMHNADEVWPSWVRHAIDFRALVIPRPGKKMVLSDLEQIEPRVLAYLSGNKVLLQLISEGYGVYEAFARATMGYTGARFDSKVKKTDFYKMLKIQVLGLGYGAGWEKFISIALNEGGIDLTEGDPEWIEEPDPITGEPRKVSGYGQKSREIVSGFREKNPLMTALWRRLDDGFKASVGGDFVVTLPSGRKMRYRDVRAAVRLDKDPKTGKPKRSTVFTADIGGRRVTSYGGKLTENVVQATARDVFGVQVVRLVEQGLRALFTVHDEVVLEVDQSVTAKDIEHEMSYCPEWIKGLPVAAEAQEVAHYQK